MIEFTPAEAGVVPWSCWMGMIPGTFIIVDKTAAPKPDAATAAESGAQETPDSEVERLIGEFKRLWSRIQMYFEDRVSASQGGSG